MARHPSLSITDEQEANLRKLAAYLLTLPADYQDFGMAAYACDSINTAHVVSCGTVACAAGHGPRAGILSNGSEHWDDYTRRAFAHGDAWDWCFSGSWDGVDDTPRGAALRINHMLEYGVPADFMAQIWGRAPYLFAAEAA